MARTGDPRARSGVAQLDAGTKTIHAAYKDLRRRDRFTADFRPTPYDVWSFRHDRAFGIPHPGSIPPAIVAHALHYYTPPGGLVVDPMAGGGTTLDVCQSMGRRCLAYDLHPDPPEIRPPRHPRRVPPRGQRLRPRSSATRPITPCSPAQYAERQRRRRPADRLDRVPPRAGPRRFRRRPPRRLPRPAARHPDREGPAGRLWLSRSRFLGYMPPRAAGFLPERRISCPMDGAYLPQQVRRARAEGRMLGQVRDLLVIRKPSHIRDQDWPVIPSYATVARQILAATGSPRGDEPPNTGAMYPA